MEKVLNSYETLFVVDCTLGEESVKAIVDKFTALISENGTIDSVDEWGKRRLAYPIDYKNDGYYVLVNFKSEGAFTLELERVFGITEGILRSIVIKHIDDKKTVKEA
ncbi:MAG: 30S ribosomal protein S6 [Clostridia bacterium]|nr:30S ribosomal protein S6 [Clostridia bacterium]MBQ9743631.1 30S ribosomal protein S6 [Clostridia bacterium]